MATPTTAAELTEAISGTKSWTLDPAGSSVRIHGKSIWNLVKVNGAFGTVTGEGSVQADGAASGTLTIDAASIDTKQGKRDKHLRSKDFFDVENHPSIVFNAAKIVARSGQEAEVTGELVVLGVAKPLGFTAKVSEASAEAVALTAELTVDRYDFGMKFNQLGMMGHLFQVEISARFVAA